MHLKILSAKRRPFCPGGDEFSSLLWKNWCDFLSQLPPSCYNVVMIPGYRRSLPASIPHKERRVLGESSGPDDQVPYRQGKLGRLEYIVNPHTVDSRYLALVGSQNSRARVKWFSRYLALSREGHDSRIQDHRPTLPGVFNSQTVCWAIIEVLTFPGSLHTSTSHQRQITTSNIRF